MKTLYPSVQNLVDEYGWNSDFIKTRVRGLKPARHKDQFMKAWQAERLIGRLKERIRTLKAIESLRETRQLSDGQREILLSLILSLRTANLKT